MHELAKVTLENEMDLILAHRRSMKLAEITGLSLSAQTTFATAVSEIARAAIDSSGSNSCLVLNVETGKRESYIVASLKSDSDVKLSHEGLANAKRLVSRCEVTATGKETSVELFYYIAPSFRIDIQKLDEWRSLFRNEPSISPYEELKRKNEQLQELSEKVQKSETQYKTLTNALPLIIFSIDDKGVLIYANEWLTKFTGATAEVLNRTQWKSVVHPDDLDTFLALLQKSEHENGSVQCRFRQVGSGDYLWHQVSLTPLRDASGTSVYRIGYIVDIHAQKSLEETLKDNRELMQTQEKLKEYQRTQEQYIEELNRSNRELQQFAFVASHDLQEPVRKLLFYSDYLLTRYGTTFEGKSVDYLNSMQQSARRMRSLIKDLLVFSQIKKDSVAFTPVDLNRIVGEARQDFEMLIEEKGATIDAADLPVVKADERMMRQLFENLISNALKYSREGVPPEITIRSEQKEGSVKLVFTDNGIGFDEQYTTQMFTLFQRLHNRSHYEGTGLGLAICKKIVELHNGEIWAKGKEGSGAAFYVLLPQNSL